MNLYIWGDKNQIPYGGECVVVMAPNLREAMKAAEKSADWSFFRHYKGSSPKNETKLGKPDKIIRNRTYAAYFMFSE